MSKIGIYYGSDTGTTESIAKKIAKELDVKDIYDVNKATADFSGYDFLIFGTSTMGLGDLQDDWEDFLSKVKAADLTGKKIALFGCGDSGSYSDTFCDGVGKIYNALKDKGATFVGSVSTDGYTFDESEALVDGKFIGLLIDEDNESDMTEKRISAWIEKIKADM